MAEISFSYVISRVRDAISDGSLGSNFKKAEVTYSLNSQITVNSATITGFGDAVVERNGNETKLVAQDPTGGVTVDALAGPDHAILVRMLVERNGQFGGATTTNLIVEDSDGRTFEYGGASSREETGQTV